MDEKIRVVLIDEHPAVRTGVAAGLEREHSMQFEITQSVASLYDAEWCLSQSDVVVIDNVEPFPLPIRTIHEANSRISIIIHTSDIGRSSDLVREGVYGLVHKNDEPSEIVRAIRMARMQRLYLSPHVQEVLAYREHVSQMFHFTRREMEILTYLVDGIPTKEICTRLVVSRAAIQQHINRMLRKTATKNRVQLILWYRNATEWRRSLDEADTLSSLNSIKKKRVSA